MAKTKRTPEVREALLRYIRAGNYHETAIKAAGVSKEFFYSWIKDDLDFANAVKEAEAQAEGEMLSCIREAALADKTWTAAAWYLERKHPDRFGRQDRRPEGSDKTEVVIRWADEEGGEG